MYGRWKRYGAGLRKRWASRIWRHCVNKRPPLHRLVDQQLASPIGVGSPRRLTEASRKAGFWKSARPVDERGWEGALAMGPKLPRLSSTR
jgi:hypothetical protein